MSRTRSLNPARRSDADRCRGVEPALGAFDVIADPRDHLPEPRRVVHLDEMRDLVGGEIIQHIGWRQDEPPRERQRSRRRARTPAARLIADRQPFYLDAKGRGIGLRGLLQVAARFALEVIARRGARYAQSRRPRREGARRSLAFRSIPFRARRSDARSGAQCRAMGSRRPEQTAPPLESAEARGDPGAMALREIFCLCQRAARRHGQDRFAVAWMNAQRVAPRAAVPAQAYRIDLRPCLTEKV